MTHSRLKCKSKPTLTALGAIAPAIAALALGVPFSGSRLKIRTNKYAPCVVCGQPTKLHKCFKCQSKESDGIHQTS